MQDQSSSIKSALLLTYDAEQVAAAQMQLQLTPDKARALFMAEKMRVDFVFNTAKLEGNPFTYPEVKTLIEGITVGGHKLSDSEQVLNLNQALSHVMGLVKDDAFQIDASTACAIQGFVARNEALKWGAFRDAAVFIGGTAYKPPPADELAEIFDRGAQYLNAISAPVLRAFLAFLWGSLQQFFYDGNKRTSRLLAIGTLLTAGLPPLTILAKDQTIYNQVMMRFYDSQDATEALVWLYGYYFERVGDLGFDASCLPA